MEDIINIGGDGIFNGDDVQGVGQRLNIVLI